MNVEEIEKLKEELEAHKPKFNKGKCKEACNCIEIAEYEEGGGIPHGVKSYPCLGDTIKDDLLEGKYSQNVKTLSELEDELINLISDTGDNKLMDKFLEWQDQRTKCNDGYLKWFGSLTSTIKNNKED